MVIKENELDVMVVIFFKVVLLKVFLLFMMVIFDEKVIYVVLLDCLVCYYDFIIGWLFGFFKCNDEVGLEFVVLELFIFG